jgi:hypothetical protein
MPKGIFSIRFKVNPNKALEAVVYITSSFPNTSQYYIAKVLYYAEKAHLNKYALPIIGDTYMKFPNGPCPSYALDLIKRTFKVSKEMLYRVEDALNISEGTGKKLLVSPKRPPNLYEFGGTELDCIDEAIAFCKDKTFDELKDISHKEKAWIKALMNGKMDYELMIDDKNPARNEILNDIRETAQFLVV